MTGLQAMAGMGALTMVCALIVWAALRASSRAGAAEERAEQAEAMARAVDGAAEVDRKAHERMADAQAASVGEPVSSARERMRKRDPKTR